MRQQALSTQKLLELLDLFERSDQSVTDARGHALRGVPGWDLFGRVSIEPEELSSWTERTGYAGMYPALRDDERVAVELHDDDDDPLRSWYRCPQTFRKKYVTARDAGVYVVSADKILNVVADLLGIAGALRGGIKSPAIHGTLWRLGDARLGPVLTPIWFVRGLAQSVDAAFAHFASTTLAEQGLILTSGTLLPHYVRPPRNYRFGSMRQALVDYTLVPCMDMPLLYRILSSAADGVMPEVRAVQFDETNNVLTIRIKTTPWHIKGVRQAKAVKYMYQQALKGRWILDASEILAGAYPERKTEESRRNLKMQSLFSGNTEWREYISNPEKGQYGFSLG